VTASLAIVYWRQTATQHHAAVCAASVCLARFTANALRIVCPYVCLFSFFYAVGLLLKTKMQQVASVRTTGIAVGDCSITISCADSHPLPATIHHTQPSLHSSPCRWGRQKSWFWANIWLHHVLSTLRPARCYQHGATGPWKVVTPLVASRRVCWWRETTKCLWQEASTLRQRQQNSAFNYTQW